MLGEELQASYLENSHHDAAQSHSSKDYNVE